MVSSLRICCALVGRRTCRENDLDIIGAAAAILELVREARQEDYSDSKVPETEGPSVT